MGLTAQILNRGACCAPRALNAGFPISIKQFKRSGEAAYRNISMPRRTHSRKKLHAHKNARRWQCGARAAHARTAQIRQSSCFGWHIRFCNDRDDITSSLTNQLKIRQDGRARVDVEVQRLTRHCACCSAGTSAAAPAAPSSLQSRLSSPALGRCRRSQLRPSNTVAQLFRHLAQHLLASLAVLQHR